MGLFPAKMLEATIISPKEDFSKMIIKIAETEKMMVKDNVSVEDLDDYYPTSRLEKLRSLEISYKDLLDFIP